MIVIKDGSSYQDRKVVTGILSDLKRREERREQVRWLLGTFGAVILFAAVFLAAMYY